MPGDHNSIMPVDGVKVIDVLLHLSLHAVEALIEPNVDRAAIAEGITGSDCLEIEDPVGSVHASSECDDHTLVLGRVAHIAINAVGVIGNYLCTYEIDALTHRARPSLDRLLRFVGDGREVGQLRGQTSAVVIPTKHQQRHKEYDSRNSQCH